MHWIVKTYFFGYCNETIPAMLLICGRFQLFIANQNLESAICGLADLRKCPPLMYNASLQSQQKTTLRYLHELFGHVLHSFVVAHVFQPQLIFIFHLQFFHSSSQLAHQKILWRGSINDYFKIICLCTNKGVILRRANVGSLGLFVFNTS